MAYSLDRFIENELRALPGNNICVDCNSKNPQWASVSFGVFMCLECSGRHRALGVHISFVRSVSMDSWNEKQINSMRMGGNDACNAFLAKYKVIPAKKDDDSAHDIFQKYNSPAAALYKDRLKATVEGTELPCDIDSYVLKANNSNGGQGGQGGHVAQGSDPLPGESNEAYVTRQRLLQEQARERMRAKFGGSSGLKATGKMAGIGSDSSYDPNASSSGINTAEITHQLSAVTLNAYSFLSSSIVAIGDTVKSATETKSSNSNNPELNSTGTTVSNKPNNNAWSAISKNAVGLFQHAAELTSDIVQIITTPEDEAAKFPRGNPNFKKDGTASTTTSGENKNSGFYAQETVFDSTNAASKSSTAEGPSTASQRSSRVSSTENMVSLNPSSSSSSLYRTPLESNSNSQTSLSNMATNNNTTTSTTTIKSSNSSPPTMKTSTSLSSTSSGGGGGVAKQGTAKKLPIEENEDFFGSFGIK